MKRILILLAVILAAVPATAQLRVKAKAESKQIGTIRTGIIRISQDEGGIYMAMTTDNQFDDPGIFNLGPDREGAAATIDDLLGILEEGDTDAMLSVESSPGHTCFVSVTKQLGVKVVRFAFDNCAGTQSMSKGELEKARKIVEKAK